MNIFIEYINDNIRVAEFIDNQFDILKNMGEESVLYDYDTFWSWWRKKIEYDNQEVSFIIITDKKEFIIPNDIVISKENSFRKQEINKLSLNRLDSNLKIISIPQKEIDIEFKKDTTKKEIKKDKPIILDTKNLSQYFRKKTREYKNEQR